MKISLPSVFLLFVSLLACKGMQAQALDTIYLKNQASTVLGRVERITKEKVRYTLGTTAIEETLPLKTVHSIRYADGDVERFTDGSFPLTGTTPYDRLNNIKLPISHIAQNFLGLTYERAITLWSSVEIEIDYIKELRRGDINIEQKKLTRKTSRTERFHEDPFGFQMRVGFKVFKPKDPYGSDKTRHLLNRSYVSVQVGVQSFCAHFTHTSIGLGQQNLYDHRYVRQSVQSISFGGRIGKQYIANNRFSFDVYAGMGINFSNRGELHSINLDVPVRYHQWGQHLSSTQNNEALYLEFGMSVGYLFHFKRDKKSYNRLF